MTRPIHRLLERQLRRGGLDLEQPPSSQADWQRHLDAVSLAYEQADQERYLQEAGDDHLLRGDERSAPAAGAQQGRAGEPEARRNRCGGHHRHPPAGLRSRRERADRVSSKPRQRASSASTATPVRLSEATRQTIVSRRCFPRAWPFPSQVARPSPLCTRAACQAASTTTTRTIQIALPRG